MAPFTPSPTFQSLVLLLTILPLALSALTASGAASQPQESGTAAAPFAAAANHDAHLHHHITLLAPILANLGFQELAMAIPAVPPTSFLSSWSGPVTLFAATDDSIRSCLTCSPALLLREHLVPGLFSYHYLTMLAFGTKLETASPGRCLTVTSDAAAGAGGLGFAGSRKRNASSTDYLSIKVFVDGIEITRPDLYNDGRIIIHGVQGFVTPLSPLSCSRDSDDAVIVGGVGAGVVGPQHLQPQDISAGTVLVRLMLRDAVVRLRDSGFSILALAMRVKYAELVTLSNMTIFAVDDVAIFGGGHSYVTNVRFHIVPDRLLTHTDLMKMPAGTTLPTLVHGQDLVVTHSGNTRASSVDVFGLGLRINYVPLKRPDVVLNLKIAVHSICLPFPHLLPADIAWASESAASAESSATTPEEDKTYVNARPSAAPPAALWMNAPHDGL